MTSLNIVLSFNRISCEMCNYYMWLYIILNADFKEHSIFHNCNHGILLSSFKVILCIFQHKSATQQTTYQVPLLHWSAWMQQPENCWMDFYEIWDWRLSQNIHKSFTLDNSTNIYRPTCISSHTLAVTQYLPQQKILQTEAVLT